MTDHEPVASAWAIHGALIDWTGKVDTKASFALTLESAVLAGVITLSGENHRLNRLDGFWPICLYWVGVAALVVGVVLAALVVKPKLRRRAASGEVANNFIYFGHLKDWDPEALEVALKQRQLLPVLSRQLVTMSRIAWRKHREMQFSMLSAGLGTALLTLAALVR